MKVLRNILLHRGGIKPVSLDVFYEEDGKAKPLVIFSHGFKGFKDWGHFNYTGELFAQAGFIFIKFNFSHNGTTPAEPAAFSDLEAFGHNNYILELEDLGRVISWALEEPLLEGQRDTEKLCLLGHSRGGGITILKASEDQRITKIATWGSVDDFIERNQQRTLRAWKEKGVIYTTNKRTHQEMPLYYQFYESLMANRERLEILKAVSRLRIPFLIVHGTQDEAVPFHEAERLLQQAVKGELLRIEGGDHTFGVKHPFAGPPLPEQAETVIRRTIRFFEEERPEEWIHGGT
jgi:fermentation-respiration switch protein FrsA (DUF1100 family)